MPPEDHPIKLLRQHLGITQTELAEKIGSSQNRVSEVENGHPMQPSMALAVWDRWRVDLVKLGITLDGLLRPGRAA